MGQMTRTIALKNWKSLTRLWTVTMTRRGMEEGKKMKDAGGRAGGGGREKEGEEDEGCESSDEGCESSGEDESGDEDERRAEEEINDFGR